MELETITTVRPKTGVDRYRQAEETLWRYYGLEHREQFVEFADPQSRLRVVEVGSANPIVFLPGTMVTGPAWGAFVRELAGYRCLLVDIVRELMLRGTLGFNAIAEGLPGISRSVLDARLRSSRTSG
jgi:hypothetical protein